MQAVEALSLILSRFCSITFTFLLLLTRQGSVCFLNASSYLYLCNFLSSGSHTITPPRVSFWEARVVPISLWWPTPPLYYDLWELTVSPATCRTAPAITRPNYSISATGMSSQRNILSLLNVSRERERDREDEDRERNLSALSTPQCDLLPEESNLTLDCFQSSISESQNNLR